MKNYTHLISEIFNTPHLVTPSYYQTLVGAVADRMNVPHLDLNGEKIDAEKLKIRAERYNAENPGERRYFYKMVDNIAIIAIDGTLVSKNGYLHTSSGILGYDGIKRRIDYAMSDPEVKAIMYVYGTPGGHVLGNFELSDYMHSLKGQKPTCALIDEQACSAGYSLASTADVIYITEHASAGSVGVLLPHISNQEKLSKEGVKVTIIHAGNHKIDANPFEDLSDEIKADLQAEVDSIYQRFTSSVARNLGVEQKVIEDTQAKVYMGQKAVDAGLAHELVTSFNAMDKFKAFINQSNQKSQSMALGHQSTGKTMTDPKDNAPAAENNGASQGMTGQQMKARISAITTLGITHNCAAVASVIALDTDIGEEDAEKVLSAVADNAPKVVADDSQDGKAQFQAKVEEADAGAVAEDSKDEVTGQVTEATQAERLIAAATMSGLNKKSK